MNLNRIRKHHRVDSVQDERKDRKGITVTLKPKWVFDDTLGRVMKGDDLARIYHDVAMANMIDIQYGKDCWGVAKR